MCPSDADARQRDIDVFKEAFRTFLETSGATQKQIATGLGISPSALRAYKTLPSYVPTPYLIHERRGATRGGGGEGLSRHRLLGLAMALLTVKAVPRRPTRHEIDALLMKAGYAPLDHDRGQDAGVLDALRHAGQRVSAAHCEAFKGAPGAIAGEWLTEVAKQEERPGPRLMFLDYLTTLALPPAAREQILADLPAEQVPVWTQALEKRQKAFEQAVASFSVRHLYRRPALERWVIWLTDKGTVPLYSTLIDRQTASQHFLQLVELLDRYGRHSSDMHGFEIGLSDEPGGFNFEIIGNKDDRVLLIDSEAGRLPGPRPYPPEITPLDGLRIEGEEVIGLYEDAWSAAWNWATKGTAVRDELVEFAKRLLPRRSPQRQGTPPRFRRPSV